MNFSLVNLLPLPLLRGINLLRPNSINPQHSRKPIYDPIPPSITKLPQPSPTRNPSPSSSSSITKQLASEIRHVRLFAYRYISRAEYRLNALFDSVIAHERTFTQTIASLAPPPESHERLIPGSLYVLVAGMAGSIVARNRNIVIRACVPAALGIGAAWVILPTTTRNVADLVWTWEERVPVVALNHLRVREAVTEGARIGKEKADEARRWTETVVKEGREALEGWVKNG